MGNEVKILNDVVKKQIGLNDEEAGPKSKCCVLDLSSIFKMVWT